VPKEQAKMEAQLNQLSQEKTHIEQFGQDLDDDLFDGVIIPSSSRLLEFKREMQQQKQSLHLETIRIDAEIA
jgi:hypothetical protein